jgi:hypothetical protein
VRERKRETDKNRKSGFKRERIYLNGIYGPKNHIQRCMAPEFPTNVWPNSIFFFLLKLDNRVSVRRSHNFIYRSVVNIGVKRYSTFLIPFDF